MRAARRKALAPLWLLVLAACGLLSARPAEASLPRNPAFLAPSQAPEPAYLRELIAEVDVVGDPVPAAAQQQPFTLAPKPHLGRYGQLFRAGDLLQPGELAPFETLVFETPPYPGEVRSLSKTRVWAFGLFSPDSRPCASLVSHRTASGYPFSLWGNCVGSVHKGLWTDPVTGIAYARARWYDPRNASFLAEDSYGDIDSSNLYAFVAWRPNQLADPLGTKLRVSAQEQEPLRNFFGAENVTFTESKTLGLFGTGTYDVSVSEEGFEHLERYIADTGGSLEFAQRLATAVVDPFWRHSSLSNLTSRPRMVRNRQWIGQESEGASLGGGRDVITDPDSALGSATWHGFEVPVSRYDLSKFAARQAVEDLFFSPEGLLFVASLISAIPGDEELTAGGLTWRPSTPRLGPRGVVPGRHNANVMIRNARGIKIHHERFVSGDMTAVERALGFPRGMLASHTEVRAVRSLTLRAGDEMVITGQLPPCPSCKGAMNTTARESGATIRYRWRSDGRTHEWVAGRQ